jgi:flagellar secretion chaperone FliS
LNHEAGGVLSQNLAGLYGYVMRLLIEANAKQIETPLAEVEALMSSLAEAWKACSPPDLAPDIPNSELYYPWRHS